MSEKTYRVMATVTISVVTTVRAKNKAEATRIARERPMMGLCHQCSSGDSAADEWVTSGELDGEPRGFSVAECEAGE